MTGANHIIGGVVYTGVFCSFWNVNVFEKPWYLVATLFFSLLPDIDHNKSILGKSLSFTKLPQYIDRNFGHRTITHSLVVYFGLGAFIFFLESLITDNHIFTLIFFLAYSSHLIFDMMTVSGVPLLFPWRKNPCVIPGNPDYRLRVNNLKSESIIFSLFLGILLFCFPLFEHGFWTSFNRSFGSLDHLNREYLKSSDLLKVEYDYTNKGDHKKGVAFLVSSEKTEVVLIKGNEVFEINDKMQIAEVLPSHSKINRIEKEVYFYNISQDSLGALIENKVLTNCDFQCSERVEFWTKSGHKESYIIKLENVVNPSFTVLQDTMHDSEFNQLEIKRIELQQELRSIAQETERYEALEREIADLNRSFNALSSSEQENAVSRLKTLRNKKLNFVFTDKSTAKIEKQIEQLEAQINKHYEAYFTGKYTYVNIPVTKL